MVGKRTNGARLRPEADTITAGGVSHRIVFSQDSGQRPTQKTEKWGSQFRIARTKALIVSPAGLLGTLSQNRWLTPAYANGNECAALRAKN